MRFKALMLTLVLLLPGCLDSEGEEIRFNGRNLEGSDVYMFTLEAVSYTHLTLPTTLTV